MFIAWNEVLKWIFTGKSVVLLELMISLLWYSTFLPPSSALRHIPLNLPPSSVPSTSVLPSPITTPPFFLLLLLPPSRPTSLIPPLSSFLSIYLLSSLSLFFHLSLSSFISLSSFLSLFLLFLLSSFFLLYALCLLSPLLSSLTLLLLSASPLFGFLVAFSRPLPSSSLLYTPFIFGD